MPSGVSFKRNFAVITGLNAVRLKPDRYAEIFVLDNNFVTAILQIMPESNSVLIKNDVRNILSYVKIILCRFGT